MKIEQRQTFRLSLFIFLAGSLEQHFSAFNPEYAFVIFQLMMLDCDKTIKFFSMMNIRIVNCYIKLVITKMHSDGANYKA